MFFNFSVEEKSVFIKPDLKLMQRVMRGRAHPLTFAAAENTFLHSSPGPVEISPNCFLYCPFSSLASNVWGTWSTVGLLVSGCCRSCGWESTGPGPDFHGMPEKVVLSAGKCSEQRRKAVIATPGAQKEETCTRTRFLLKRMFSSASVEKPQRQTTSATLQLLLWALQYNSSLQQRGRSAAAAAWARGAPAEWCTHYTIKRKLTTEVRLLFPLQVQPFQVKSFSAPGSDSFFMHTVNYWSK